MTTQLTFDFSTPAAAKCAVNTARRLRGRVSQLAGEAAEGWVADDYQRRGYRLLHRRWRGKAGEIDLILSDDRGLVFVEVKKSACFERALSNLSARQVARIYHAAEEFAGTQDGGSLTDMRFDVALMDQHGALQIMENMAAAY